MNIDAKENELITLLTVKKEINASIMAIDKCGKKSDSNSMILPIPPPTDCLNSESGTGTSTTSCTCSSCNTKIVSSIIATLLVTLVAAVVSMVIIWRIYKSPKVSVHAETLMVVYTLNITLLRF